MKTKIAVALIINACVVSPTTAGDIYRWTDPNTGKLTTSPSIPTYPIKESRITGQLPNGNLIEVILDFNAPQVKAIVEKRKVREAEERRITEEKQKEKLVREAEQRKITEKEQEERKRIAAQKAKEDAEYKEKYWKQRDAEREEESRKEVARLAAKDYEGNYKATASATGEWEKSWSSVQGASAERCAKIFDNFQLQAVCMENERKGYDAMQSNFEMPSDVARKAKERCAKTFEDQFQLQAVCMENEKKGYEKMKKY
jgi:AAA15 family ATPase/GTPase